MDSSGTGQWTAAEDAAGRFYYYNMQTQESRWDPPPGFDAGSAAAGTASTAGPASAASGGTDGTAAPQAVHMAVQSEWLQGTDEAGRPYFFNTRTQVRRCLSLAFQLLPPLRQCLSLAALQQSQWESPGQAVAAGAASTGEKRRSASACPPHPSQHIVTFRSTFQFSAVFAPAGGMI